MNLILKMLRYGAIWFVLLFFQFWSFFFWAKQPPMVCFSHDHGDVLQLETLRAENRVVQMGFSNIRLTLSVPISELRESYQKVSPEMNVSRRVDYRSTQDHYLTPSDEKVTAIQRRQQNRKNHYTTIYFTTLYQLLHQISSQIQNHVFSFV